MSDQMSTECTNIDSSESSLHKILRNCANFQSSESLLIEDFNDVNNANSNFMYYKMLSNHSPHSVHSSSVSTSSYASDESFGDNILEENGRISLAYENLKTIPKRIAEKFATHTKCLDLSYNNFQNLSFLSYFETLDTLILDHNELLDVNTLPYLANLRILWINNCNITNVTEWTQRIQMQCPVLEHLSVMGNPGIKAKFSFCKLTSTISNDSIAPTTIVSDYREYILHALPRLEILDGEARYCSNSSTLPSVTLPSMKSSFHAYYAQQQNLNEQHHRQQQKQYQSFSKTPSLTESINSIKNGYSRPLNGKHNAPNTNNNSDNGFYSNGSNNNKNNNINHKNFSSNNNNNNTYNNNYGNKNSDSTSNNSSTVKAAPALGFKEIFRLKRRRKSFLSSPLN